MKAPSKSSIGEKLPPPDALRSFPEVSISALPADVLERVQLLSQVAQKSAAAFWASVEAEEAKEVP